MLRRLVSLLLLGWLLGFVAFAVALPGARPGARTDAVVVLTGGKGRIERGLAVLRTGHARRMLVSGVDRQVRAREFAAHYRVPAALMACCVTLGFAAVDTESNARETARWVAAGRIGSVRLVTSDWHMRRARFELGRVLPRGTTVVSDAVRSEPSLKALFLEYNKLLLGWASAPWR